MHRFKEILQHFVVKSIQNQELLISNGEMKTLTKNQFITEQNKHNKSEYFVLSGVVHRFNISSDGEPISTGFYMSQSVVTPHFARTINNKSIFSLQTLTEVEIIEIPILTFNQLRYEQEEIRQLGQKVLENELARNLATDITYRTLTAKERLLLLRKQFPNLENLIPHHIIASYLGITNVSFSRLRSEM